MWEIMPERHTREAINLDAVQLVADRHLDLLKPIQDVQLGQVQARVAVDHVRVAHDDQVEPAATTSAAGGGTVLGTDFLQGAADLAEVLCRERSTAHTGRVRLDDANDLFDDLGRETETGANTANGGGRRRDIGVRAVVDIQHERIRALDQDALAALERVVQERRPVDNVRAQALGKGEVHFNLALGVKLKVTVSLETALDELAELGGERGVVQVVHAQTGAGGFGRVGRSDTPARGADGRTAELDFLEPVDDLVEAQHEVGAVRDLETARTGETLALERVELVEQGGNVDDDARADKGGDLFVDQSCVVSLLWAYPLIASPRHHTLRLQLSQPDSNVLRTRRQQVERKGALLARLGVLDDDSVTGIVSAGATRADVGVGREDIDELAFALITPLGTEAVRVSYATVYADDPPTAGSCFLRKWKTYTTLTPWGAVTSALPARTYHQRPAAQNAELAMVLTCRHGDPLFYGG